MGSLNFSRGSNLEAAQLNELATLMRDVLKSRMVSGRGVRLAMMPDGVLPRVAISSVSSTQYNFQVSTEEADSGAVRVRIGFGTVDGVEPVIGTRRISEEDADGDTPYLTVMPEDFARRGYVERSMIYLKYSLSNPDGRVIKVEPIASPMKPNGIPWVWNRLLAILTRDDQESPAAISQQLFFNQRFLLTNIRGGYGTPWPWASP